jgi:8-oxo-dGTP pyrophosphatase MutT (NUDIX family)
MNWFPHVTVATVVERDGHFLLVEEWADGRLVFNQPAGHLEPNETLLQAAQRETLEETAWTVQLQGVVGIALYTAPGNGATYYRTTFFGAPERHEPARRLDDGIVRAVWLTIEEMRAQSAKMRSPLVIEVVNQYLSGQRYPLSMILN